MILDSNVIIYSLLPEHARIREFIATNLPGVSGITYVEVLGFHRITPGDRDALLRMFSRLEMLDVDRAVLDRAVSLRQLRRMSLGDAIIAATALVHDRPLVTRNVDDFRWIVGLSLLNPFEAQPPQ